MKNEHGWIKLWRKFTSNGHFTLKGTVFKLWIYCLLEATPYPDPLKGLGAGELWLSYNGIREELTEGERKISMSSISSALKHLEEHGYIKLQRQKFVGVKASIINWDQYQSPSNKTAAQLKAAIPQPKLKDEFEGEFSRKLSPIELGQLSEWEKDCSKDLIIEALSLASQQNKRSLGYVGGILQNLRSTISQPNFRTTPSSSFM